MMSHATLVVAALSVATAQLTGTAQFTGTPQFTSPVQYSSTQFGTYQNQIPYPVQLQSSVQYPLNFNPFNNNISPVFAGSDPEFEVPALFQPLECIVTEDLTVTTDSVDSVGRTLTYERELTCDCDSNGNPIADSCVRPDDGYLAGSCYERVACEVELKWTTDTARFTGEESGNPFVRFELKKTLGCYCDILGNPQFEQCVDKDEQDAYDAKIAEAFLLWEAEQQEAFEQYEADFESWNSNLYTANPSGCSDAFISEYEEAYKSYLESQNLSLTASNQIPPPPSCDINYYGR